MQDYVESRVASGAKWTWSTLRCASCFYAPLQIVPLAVAQTWVWNALHLISRAYQFLFSCASRQR
jgi:hypothetical protein